MECCHDISCLYISVDKEESIGGSTKESPWCNPIVTMYVLVVELESTMAHLYVFQDSRMVTCV